MFYCDNFKSLKISINADTVLEFSYLDVKLPNFKLVDKKLPELEPLVSHSFHIKIVSRKKLSGRDFKYVTLFKLDTNPSQVSPQ